VFYELLAGQPPFTSASPRELLNLHCTAAVPPLPDHVRRGLPKGVERLVFQLLEKRAEDRPASADAVVEALEPFAASELDLGTMRVYKTDRASSAPRVDTRPSPGQTEVPAPPQVSTARPVAQPPLVADTIGLIERASGPRQIPAGWALAIVLVLSALAGVVTWFIRTGNASGAELPSSSVTAVARPAR
jgi:serine/threonine-protein kinase